MFSKSVVEKIIENTTVSSISSTTVTTTTTSTTTTSKKPVQENLTIYTNTRTFTNWKPSILMPTSDEEPPSLSKNSAYQSVHSNLVYMLLLMVLLQS